MKNQEEIKKQFDEIIKFDEDILLRIDSFMQHAPEGSISVESTGKPECFRYKHYLPGKSYKRIPVDKTGFIRQMVTKEYYIRLRPAITAELKAIRAGHYGFGEQAKFEAYDGMHPGKKSLIEPIFASPAYKVQKWMHTKYKQNTSHPEKLIYFTKRGEKRRSKSERDISDELDQHLDELAYWYEPYIYLEKSGKWICPDFVIIVFRTGEIFYWEHAGGFGMPGYDRDFVEKMQAIGEESREFREKFIFTYEDDIHPLQPSMYMDIIDHILHA